MVSLSLNILPDGFPNFGFLEQVPAVLIVKLSLCQIPLFMRLCPQMNVWNYFNFNLPSRFLPLIVNTELRSSTCFHLIFFIQRNLLTNPKTEDASGLPYVGTQFCIFCVVHRASLLSVGLRLPGWEFAPLASILTLKKLGNFLCLSFLICEVGKIIKAPLTTSGGWWKLNEPVCVKWLASFSAHSNSQSMLVIVNAAVYN